MSLCIPCIKCKANPRISEKMKWCKPCRSAYDKDRYQKFDKGRQTQKNRESYKRNSRFVLDFLFDKKCMDCPEKDPVVLDFDHRSDKIKNVADMIRSRCSLKRLKTEIDKCDIRCANCHRRKTAKEQGWSKFLDAKCRA